MFRNVMYTELFFIWIYKAGACKHTYRCINPLWVKKRLPLYHQYTFAWNCSFSSAYVASNQPLSFKMSDVWFVDTENGCQCEFSLNRWRERLMKVACCCLLCRLFQRCCLHSHQLPVAFPLTALLHFLLLNSSGPIRFGQRNLWDASTQTKQLLTVLLW